MIDPTRSGARDAERAEVLALTSALRVGLEGLEVDRADPAARASVSAAGLGLADAAARHGIEPLARSSQALLQLRELGHCLDAFDPAATSEVVGSLLDAVGILEQSLEAALATAAPARLQALAAMFDATWPRLDGRAAAIDRLVATPPQRADRELPVADEMEIERDSAAVGPEGEFLEAFIAEAAESFERCEEALLALDQRPSDARLLAAFAEELHTIRDATAVVGLSAAAAQLDATTALVAAVQDDSVAVDDQALVDFLLRLLDSVKGLIDQACGDGDSTLVIIADVNAEIAALRGGTGLR